MEEEAIKKPARKRKASQQVPGLSPVQSLCVLAALLLIGVLGVWLFSRAVSVVIIWGLIAGICLSLVVHSYARVIHRRPGLSIELGGPAAVFFLVLVGGYRLAPQPPARFALTIRPHALGKPPITTGSILLKSNDGARTVILDPQGDAAFANLNSDLLDTEITIVPFIDSYEVGTPTKDKKVTIDRELMKNGVVDLDLVPVTVSFDGTVIFDGTVFPKSPFDGEAKMCIQGCSKEENVFPVNPSDHTFKGKVALPPGIDRMVTVCIAGKRVFYEKETIGPEMQLKLEKLQKLDKDGC
jgi:hypothetical protein